MNKWIKYTILFLIVSKITFSGVLLKKNDKGTSTDTVVTVASAEEKEDASSAEKGKDEKNNFSQEEIAILTSLEKRRLELSRKEEGLSKEEERLNRLKHEIEDKILKLRKVEKRIEDLIKLQGQIENKSLDHLAKVYESTPAEQAGPMLSKLDVKLAASILMRINGRKAGKIWAFVNPTQAVKISEELAKKR